MGVSWDDETEGILTGDLTAALGYRTPAAGVVVQAVAPIGLHVRAAGTVGFTTSLGLSKKLERIAHDPRVSMAFHAREHGSSESERYVLFQGRARVVAAPTPEELDHVAAQAQIHLGSAKRGRLFWDRWLREYYHVRVPVYVDVERIVTWSNLSCAGQPSVVGRPLRGAPPLPQRPPKGGTGPRVDTDRVGKLMRATDHRLLGYAGDDGYPIVVPVEVGEAEPDGLALTSAAPLPPRGRRAGLLGHSYRPKLIGLEARQCTGWLDVDDEGDAIYAPHTLTGYKAPPNKTLLLLLNGGLAKQGVRKAARAERATG